MPDINDISSRQQPHTIVNLDALMAPILVSTRHHGTVELRPLSFDDLRFVRDLTEQQLSPQEFAVSLLSHQVTNVEQAVNYFSNLPLPVLTHIAITWLKHEGSATWAPSPEISLLQSFQESLSSYSSDWQRQMAELADKFTGNYTKLAQSITSGINIASLSHIDLSRSFMQSLQPALQYMSSSMALYNVIGRTWIPTQPLLASSLGCLDLNFSHTIIESIQPALDNLHLSVAGLLEKLQPRLLEDITSQANNLAKAVTRLSSTLSSIAEASLLTSSLDLSQMLPSWNASAFMAHLPNLADMLDAWERARRKGERLADGHLALAESGYEFAGHLWTVAFVERFADVNPQVRSAIVNKRMAAVLRTRRFENHLQTTFLSSAVAARRWPFIAKGLRAHSERDYETSIPLLMIQIEGVIGDMLLVKGLVVARGKKLYVRDVDGTVKKDRKGRAIEIRGLGSLIDQSDFKDHEILKTVAQLVKNELVGTRNPVLHGRHLRYGSAKLSSQCLLILYVLAQVLLDIEKTLRGAQTP